MRLWCSPVVSTSHVFNTVNTANSLQSHSIQTHLTRCVVRRFYAALVLSDLIQEEPVAKVAEKYKVARGAIQALQDQASECAAGMGSSGASACAPR